MLGNPDIADVGERRVSQLVGGLALVVMAIVSVAVVGRLIMQPALVVQDAPIAIVAVLSLALVFALTRTRLHRLAAFVFCFNFVWLNVTEGLQRPDGPVWYALVPLAAIMGGALLRFRAALALAVLGLLGVLMVLALTDHIPAERGSLMVMYVALANAAALGMAVFRERVERERRAELERLSAQLAASDRMESIGRLAGGIAHDFNNLLTVMLNCADAVRTGELDALDDLVGAGERAADLTKQLLAFSRQPGRRTGNVAIDQAIAEVRPLLRRLLPENIELELELAANARVRLEDQQLEQLLFNLAANARDAMPNGGRLTIESSIDFVAAGAGTAPTERVLIRVSDTGAGMNPKTRAHALEPFFTTKAPGKGTGLGLATVHAIVTQAGGHLHIESALGQGTRVELAFPRAQASAEPAATPAEPDERFEGRVLLVEDEPLVMRATSRLLSGLGLTVIAASRPDDVGRTLADSPGPLALLITDVVMPGRSGPELLKELRRAQPDLPVLFISGYANEDLRQVLRMPRTLFLAKPFTRLALSASLHELLRPRPRAAPASLATSATT